MDKTEGLSTIFDRLFADFKVVLADGEKLLDATAKEGGETFTALRATMAKRLDDVKVRLSQAEEAASQKTQAAAKAAEEYICANPWQSLLAVGGLAALVGYLLGRVGSPKQ